MGAYRYEDDDYENDRVLGISNRMHDCIDELLVMAQERKQNTSCDCESQIEIHIETHPRGQTMCGSTELPFDENGNPPITFRVEQFHMDDCAARAEILEEAADQLGTQLDELSERLSNALKAKLN